MTARSVSGLSARQHEIAGGGGEATIGCSAFGLDPANGLEAWEGGHRSQPAGCTLARRRSMRPCWRSLLALLAGEEGQRCPGGGEALFGGGKERAMVGLEAQDVMRLGGNDCSRHPGMAMQRIAGHR